MTVEQAFALAIAHHQAGKLTEAERIYRQILAQIPAQPDALHLLGLVCHQTDRTSEALDLIRRAIGLNPNTSNYHEHLGLVFTAAGRWDEAIASHRRALALNPRPADVHSNLGLAYQGAERLDDAIDSFRRALTIRSDFPEAHFNLARALHEKGELETATVACRTALSLRPNYFEALLLLGDLLRDHGDWSGTVASYRQASNLKPESVQARHNWALALHDSGRFDDAIAIFAELVRERPDNADAAIGLGNGMKEIGLVDRAIEYYQRAAALRTDPKVEQNLLVCRHYLPDADPQMLLSEHREWNRRHAEPLTRHARPPENDRVPDRRLRIGYVSPDFSFHPVGRCLLPVLQAHDPAAVEVYGYCDISNPDEITRASQAASHVWRSTACLSDPQLANLIRSDRIDVLVDLAAHTRGNRLLTFARRPAPVQVTWLGWPGTTGLNVMDYRLSDPYLDPPDVDPSTYSEQTICLPNCFWCYGPPEDAIAVGELPAQTRGHITFGSLNHFVKVNEPLLRLWATILSAVRDSKLLMRAPVGQARRRVRERMHSFEIDTDRVSFVGPLPWQEYWDLYHQIDVCLDAFPYNGHVTSLDALWMGVPVVTMPGRLPVGRAGLSFLSNLSLTQFVADNPEDYVRIARNLATDFDGLAELRGGLRRQMQRSPMLNAGAFARDLERAFGHMWQVWCRQRRNVP